MPITVAVWAAKLRPRAWPSLMGRHRTGSERPFRATPSRVVRASPGKGSSGDDPPRFRSRSLSSPSSRASRRPLAGSYDLIGVPCWCWAMRGDGHGRAVLLPGSRMSGRRRSCRPCPCCRTARRAQGRRPPGARRHCAWVAPGPAPRRRDGWRPPQGWREHEAADRPTTPSACSPASIPGKQPAPYPGCGRHPPIHSERLPLWRGECCPYCRVRNQAFQVRREELDAPVAAQTHQARAPQASATFTPTTCPCRTCRLRRLTGSIRRVHGVAARRLRRRSQRPVRIGAAPGQGPAGCPRRGSLCGI